MRSPLTLTLPLLLLASGVQGQGKEFEVESRSVAWEEAIRQGFDPAAGLPEVRSAPGRDLPSEMERLLELRFETRDRSGRVLRSFGDLAQACRSMTGRERDLWFQDLERRSPRWMQDWGEGIRELIFDEALRSKTWDPEEATVRDGLLEAEAWDLSSEGSSRWTELPNAPRAEQAAVLIHAGTPAIKRIENDFRLYRDFRGADYESIYPKKREYLRGVDANGDGFATVGLHFRCDLPFPYSDYTCHLRILNRVVEGRLSTDIFSDSEDFHWLAGRDKYLPVETSEGEFVGILLVRQYGFDLDGVPDKPKHRRSALRGSLGNLKRAAEALPEEERLAGGSEVTLPNFRVFGRW